jgi:hypothetical protein
MISSSRTISREYTCGEGTVGSVTEETLSLDSAITTLDLSARVSGLLERKKIHTLREALALDPQALVEEKNFGRKSLVELRSVIERAAGRPWEDARDALSDAAPSPDADRSLPAATPRHWNDVGPWLPAALAATPLDSVRDLPARLRTFAQSRAVTTLGQLFAIPASQLVVEPNLGRKSLADTVQLAVALNDSVSITPKTLRSFDSFAALFRSALAPLRQIERMVVAGRAGLTEAPATLVEIGDMLGVSRERARQLEARALNELLRDRWWIDALDATLFDLTRDALLDLDEVAERDPWLASAFSAASVFDFVCDRLLDGRYHRVTVDDAEFLAQLTQDALDARWAKLSATLASGAYPCEPAAVADTVSDGTRELGAGVRALFSERVRALLKVEDGQVVGFGENRHREILRWLGQQPAPVSVNALAERFGRGHWPDEMVFVERGLVWIRERLQGFDSYVEPVSDACVTHLRAHGAERQWSCSELAPVVEARITALPPWFGPWPLAALLARGERVRYLGRGVVALPDVAGDRVYIHELLVSTLREAGAPLPLDVVAQRARARRSIGTLAFASTLRKMPFVRVGPGVVGLWDRDVPGDESHVQRANEQVFHWLSSAGVGLSARRTLERLELLDPYYRQWNTDILRSAWLRDERLRATAAMVVGLAEWGDPRVPTRKAIVESAVANSGGRASIDAIIEQIERVHGERLSRNAVGWMGYHFGARREGEWLVVDGGGAAVECEALLLFPQLARGVAIELEALASEPATVEQLRAGVDEHSRQLFLDAVVNEAIDLDTTTELQRRSHALLDRYASERADAQRWIRAAVQYFIVTNDASSDFVEGGLEDDRAVMDAVERWLSGEE